MKLNKIGEILKNYKGELQVSRALNEEYIDFYVKHDESSMFYRLYKDNDIAKIYGYILVDNNHYICKEIGSIDSTYMPVKYNYIVHPTNQIAYSAAIVVSGMTAYDAVEAISEATTENDDLKFDFKIKDEKDAKDKEWWDAFPSSLYFTQASIVAEDNKILGKYRLDKLNVPFIKNTKTEDIVYLKVELPEILLTGNTLKRFRVITNKVIVNFLEQIFGAGNFKVYPTNEPYKTAEVVKENAKYMKPTKGGKEKND